MVQMCTFEDTELSEPTFKVRKSHISSFLKQGITPQEMEKYFQQSESKTVFLDQLERINGPSVISLLAYTNNSSGMSVSFTLLFRCQIYKKQLHTVNTSQFCRSNSFRTLLLFSFILNEM